MMDIEIDPNCFVIRLALIIAERLIPRLWRRLTRDKHPTDRTDT